MVIKERALEQNKICVQVKFFALARELAVTSWLEVELPVGATMQTLADILFQAYPGLSDMRLRFAVNAAYAGADVVLDDGDEVALIPPVGGG